MIKFLRMCAGILSCVIFAKLTSYGLYAPNSTAADFYFFFAFCFGVGGIWCFIGELFE